MTVASNPIRWFQLYLPRPFSDEMGLAVLRAWASDRRSPVVILEAVASAGSVSYLLGSPASDFGVVREALLGNCPDAQLVAVSTGHDQAAPSVRPGGLSGISGSLRASTRHRALSTVDLPARSRAVLAALSRSAKSETVRLQVILGPRRIPLAVPNQSPSAMVRPWWEVAWYGNGGQIDGEKRAALRSKVSQHGFACVVRIGAVAASRRRQEDLVLGVLAAIRSAETAGLQLRLTRESPRHLNSASRPWRWPLRLGLGEVLALLGWPVSTGGRNDDLPGLPAPHPKPLPPARPITRRPPKASDRVLAETTAPGMSVPLTLPIEDQLRHLHLIGPTGVGKSTLAAQLVLRDISAGRGCVVIDPKGDLVDDILARVEPANRDRIVVLDPADTSRPVGFNPLSGAGRRPDLAADSLLAVFHQLWADSWGPRTADILQASLLTICRRPDASLVMLPLLLTNPAFRRPLVAQAVQQDPFALGPFWAWYEHLSDAERAAVIAPLQNKIRSFLLRPGLRAMLGQSQPKFSVRQVFTERKVLLVSLSKGRTGPEAAALIGSLVVAELWQTTLERASVPADKRRPVHVVIDEVQDYLHLPTDLSDALAQARGYGVGFTLSHQYLGQLPKDMQAAVLANARSRVCFQLPSADAAVLAKGHPELEPADFETLGQHQVYASLHRDGRVQPYVSGRTLALSQPLISAGELRAYSRGRYGVPLADVEAELARLATTPADAGGNGSRPGRRRLPTATTDPQEAAGGPAEGPERGAE